MSDQARHAGERSGARIAWALVALFSLPACSAARLSGLERKTEALSDEVAELRRGQAAQRVQFDAFRNRLVMLQDQLESERVQAARRHAAEEAPGPLPRIIVQPRQEASVAAPAPGPPQRTALGPRPPASNGGQGATRSVIIGPDGVPHDTSAKPATRRPKSRHSPAAAGPGGTRTPKRTQTREERAAGAYRAAKELLDARRLPEARSAFSAFLRTHRTHPLADNALYWLGESWYAQALWLKAARTFGSVIERFPRGNKVPDAMLKTALCYRNLGERKLAVDVLGQLLSLYPGTPAAAIAQRLQASLGGS